MPQLGCAHRDTIGRDFTIIFNCYNCYNFQLKSRMKLISVNVFGIRLSELRWVLRNFLRTSENNSLLLRTKSRFWWHYNDFLFSESHGEVIKIAWPSHFFDEEMLKLEKIWPELRQSTLKSLQYFLVREPTVNVNEVILQYMRTCKSHI